MYTLKGYTNIVSYEDRVTEPWTESNSFGCDLLIRMELLRDLRKVIQTGYIFSETEIIQIGKDICTALTLCHNEKEPIIHRDIKPENIFVNSGGTYKLGDFGVSRILEKCHGRTATTVIGTSAYLAPEQLRKGYDDRVDIYSLGLVLYELSNRNRLPFSEYSYIEEKAIRIRIAGNKLPTPCEASPEFAKVILKACAFNRNARHHTAQEMLEALNKLSAVKSAKRIAKKCPLRIANRQIIAMQRSLPSTYLLNIKSMLQSQELPIEINVMNQHAYFMNCLRKLRQEIRHRRIVLVVATIMAMALVSIMVQQQNGFGRLKRMATARRPSISVCVMSMEMEWSEMIRVLKCSIALPQEQATQLHNIKQDEFVALETIIKNMMHLYGISSPLGKRIKTH